MAYREVSVFEIKEVLRLWLRGEGYRGIDRLSGADRKTVRRYVEAAVDAGVTPDGDEAQLTDVVIGLVCEKVRPARPAGHAGPAPPPRADAGLHAAPHQRGQVEARDHPRPSSATSPGRSTPCCLMATDRAGLADAAA